MNKIEQLLQQLDGKANSGYVYNGLPLDSKDFLDFATITIKHFCKGLIKESRYLSSGDSVTEFIEDYIKPDPIYDSEEIVKVTISTLKNFDYGRVFSITGLNLIKCDDDSEIVEISKLKFNQLFK